MRANREEGFAELVNALQCVFLDRDVESFDDGQLHTLHDVFERLSHEQDEFSDDFANAITADLIRGGIDVFRELD